MISTYEQKKFDIIFELDTIKNKSILDVGCGNKTFFNYLDILGFNGKRTGYDKDKKFNTTSLSDINGIYDIITMFEVVEHITLEEFRFYLEWIKKRMNKNSNLIITTPNIKNIFLPFWARRDHIRPYSLEDLEKTLIEHKFKIIKKGYSHYIKNPFKILFCLFMNVNISYKVWCICQKL